MLFEHFLSLIISYLIGSFPTAYVILKLYSNKDIRQEGSGIVGTMNAFEVSQSKIIGVIVLLLDMAKGILALILCINLFMKDVALIFVSGLGVVLGHVYPIWLKFKGGRGLAVSAGVFLLTCWIFIVIWIIIFALTYLIKRNLHLSNILATMISPACLFLVPNNILKMNIIQFSSVIYLNLFVIPICLILLASHSDQIKKLIKVK